MEIPIKIQEEIKSFCKANNIEDVDKFLIKIINKGFSIEKYGMQPITKKGNVGEYVPLKLPEKIEVIKETVEQPIEEKKKDLYDEE